MEVIVQQKPNTFFLLCVCVCVFVCLHFSLPSFFFGFLSPPLPLEPQLSIFGALCLMALTTGLVAFQADLLVSSIDAFRANLNLSEAFVG